MEVERTILRILWLPTLLPLNWASRYEWYRSAALSRENEEASRAGGFCIARRKLPTGSRFSKTIFKAFNCCDFYKFFVAIQKQQVWWIFISAEWIIHRQEIIQRFSFVYNYATTNLTNIQSGLVNWTCTKFTMRLWQWIAKHTFCGWMKWPNSPIALSSLIY